jgi:hypothetical protein
VYLAAFFRIPSASGEAAWGRTTRLDYFWASLLRPDDLVRAWVDGFAWNTLAERGVVLGMAAVILCVAIAAGWACLRLLHVDRVLSRLEMCLFSIGVGLNLVSLFTLALGLAGWLRWEAFLACGLLVCVAAGTLYFRAGCASGTREMAAEAGGDSLVGRRWLGLMAPFVVAIVLSAMLPPGDFDVREYHLQAPKEFYQSGRITFIPHNVYANMPLGAELLALPAMVVLDDWWTGALVGKTLIALFAPLAAIALYAACCRFASASAGVVAALVYVSIPWVAAVSTQGLVEGAFGFYLLAAMYGALIWKQATCESRSLQGPTAPAAGLLIMTGFLAGGAVSTKYPGVVYVLLPLAAYIVYQAVASQALREAPGRAPRTATMALCLFLLGAALGCGLWIAKNAALTGNPTYPLLYELFDGATRTPEKNDRWQQAHRPPNYDPGDLARRAWTATLASDWLSPLVVPLAALAFASRRTRRLALLVTGYLVFVFAAWWLLTHRIDRFLVPVLPLAAMLAGLGATWSRAIWWRRSRAAFLAIGLAFNFLVIAGGAAADPRYLADYGALRVDPLRVNPWHLYFNAHSGEVTGLLLVGDAQPFDLEVPVAYNTVFDDSIFETLARGRTPEEVRAALAERGISHVYVDWSEIARYRSPGNYGISDFLQPDVFADLAAAGVLEPLPPRTGSAGQAFRVLAKPLP